MDIKSTLAGLFDSSKNPKIVAKIPYNSFGTAIREIPSENSNVIVVIYKARDSYVVPTDIYYFMPNGVSISAVASFEDAIVEKLTKELRQIRALSEKHAIGNPNARTVRWTPKTGRMVKV